MFHDINKFNHEDEATQGARAVLLSFRPSSGTWAAFKGHCHVPKVDLCAFACVRRHHPSCYQSPFDVIAPRTRWHRLKANYSTGDQTDESWTWGRWLSICPKRMSAHLYACVRGRQRLNAILTSVKVCCVFVCVHACLWACTKQARQLSESPCSYATWWIHSKKCHPHSNYNTSMASCPTVMRGERVWMCACVHAYVCVSSKQRQHHLSDPVTVCMSVQDAKAAGTQRCKPQLAAWLCISTAQCH